VFGY
jgi:hypothetical protein